MNDAEQTRAVIETYYEALANGEIDRIPIAPDCTYRGSMLSEVLTDAGRIREHIGEIAPFIERLEILRMVVEGGTGAVVSRLTSLSGQPIEGAVFFEVRDGQLAALYNYFDTHPLYKGS